MTANFLNHVQDSRHRREYSASLTLSPNSQYSGLRDYIHYSGQVPWHLYSTALRDATMS
jgi:hypothetical protein